MKMNIHIKRLLKLLIIPLSIIGLTVVMQFLLVTYDFNWSHTISRVLKSLSSILVIVGMAWLAINLIGYGKRLILEQHEMNSADNLKARKIYTQMTIFQRILNFVIVLVAIALILLNFEGIRKVGISLLASAGIAGLIIGFAAQKFISTVIAGLQIAFAQPIRIDDVVIVEGEWGIIEEITLTYVVVRIWDKRRLIVPTTFFMDTPFQNWTRNTSEIIGTVFIYVDYGAPIDKLRNELTRILEGNELWDGKVNVLQVTNAGEKTMELRALVSAMSSSVAWDLRVDVRERLILFMQNNYPQYLPKSRVSVDKELVSGV